MTEMLNKGIKSAFNINFVIKERRVWGSGKFADRGKNKRQADCWREKENK